MTNATYLFFTLVGRLRRKIFQLFQRVNRAHQGQLMEMMKCIMLFK